MYSALIFYSNDRALIKQLFNNNNNNNNDNHYIYNL